MSNWNVPLWSAFVVAGLLSFLYIPISKDFTVNGIIQWNIFLYIVCGLIYGGEFIYKKIKYGKCNK